MIRLKTVTAHCRSSYTFVSRVTYGLDDLLESFQTLVYARFGGCRLPVVGMLRVDVQEIVSKGALVGDERGNHEWI